MTFTSFQQKVLNWAAMAKVSYHRDMWTIRHEIAYVSPDKPLDKIHIAKDLPSEEIKSIALLHEVGHIYFNHTSLDLKEEVVFIKDIFKELNKPFSLIRIYGGPMTFINICQDLEVNSKLLTISNVNAMNKFVKICTTKNYDVKVLDNFRDYYRPLIEKLSDNDKEMEQLKDSIKDILDSLNSTYGSMSDLSNCNDVDTSELDKEITNEIKKENYKSKCDNSKNEEESTVEKILDSIKSGSSSSNPGSYHNLSEEVEVKGKSSKEIIKFLSKIINTSMNYQPDSLKHYNRCSRSNPTGILYTSLRRRAQMDKKTLDIIIDVSGSMNTSDIILACKSLKDSFNVLSPDSMVITHDTQVCEEFKITNIPDTVRSGGGTNLFNAVKYVYEKKHCDNIVIYSDFEDDLSQLSEFVNKKKINLYSIFVSNNGRCPSYVDSITSWNNFVKANKKMLNI